MTRLSGTRLIPPVENKELCARFDGGRLSSDGGALVLRGIEKRLGLAAHLVDCLTDTRDPANTTHTYADMIAARIPGDPHGEPCRGIDGGSENPPKILALSIRPGTS